MVTVIPRAEWGARYPDGGGPAPVPFTEWWLHHSVTIAPDMAPPFDDEYTAMRTLEAIGQQRFGQGISYTWPIMPNGRVYQGHSVDRLGAHTAGRNSVARAICLVGNYDTSRVTSQQIEAAAQLMVGEYRAGRAKRYTLNGGHRQLKATTCPGRYGMEAIPAINARATALMNGATPTDLTGDDMPTAKEIAEYVWAQLIIPAVGGPGGSIGPAGAADFLRHATSQASFAAANTAGLQAAVSKLADAVAGGDSVKAEELKAAVREAMAEVVRVEVSVSDDTPAAQQATRDADAPA